jgi:hypothetical protein
VAQEQHYVYVRSLQLLLVGNLDAPDILCGKHSAATKVPIYARRVNAGEILKIRPEALRQVCLVDIVQLLEKFATKLIYQVYPVLAPSQARNPFEKSSQASY